MLEGRKELQDAMRVYKCASSGTDTASLIASCVPDGIGREATQAAACVSKFGGDTTKLAGCAASTLLPPQLGPVASCALGSSSGVGVALCVAGPSMNEEWRIAAECAANTGGEPMSFVGCTAGRLTLREFQKCLGGKIGKDCFGKNNTIVKAFLTIGNDLKNCFGGGPCLGESNDVVKGVEAIGDGLEHLGGEAKKVWDDLFGSGSAWCRNDLTRWTC